MKTPLNGMTDKRKKPVEMGKNAKRQREVGVLTADRLRGGRQPGEPAVGRRIPALSGTIEVMIEKVANELVVFDDHRANAVDRIRVVAHVKQISRSATAHECPQLENLGADAPGHTLVARTQPKQLRGRQGASIAPSTAAVHTRICVVWT